MAIKPIFYTISVEIHGGEAEVVIAQVGTDTFIIRGEIDDENNVILPSSSEAEEKVIADWGEIAEAFIKKALK